MSATNKHRLKSFPRTKINLIVNPAGVELNWFSSVLPMRYSRATMRHLRFHMPLNRHSKHTWCPVKEVLHLWYHLTLLELQVVTEQLPQFELMVREYERSASATYPDDLKIAAVVTALPPSLRVLPAR